MTLRTQMRIEGQEGNVTCPDFQGPHPKYSHVQHVLDKYDASLIRAQRSWNTSPPSPALPHYSLFLKNREWTQSFASTSQGLYPWTTQSAPRSWRIPITSTVLVMPVKADLARCVLAHHMSLCTVYNASNKTQLCSLFCNNLRVCSDLQECMMGLSDSSHIHVIFTVSVIQSRDQVPWLAI